MIDIPIVFSAPMVRAILEGRKTQTRRTGKVWFSRYERFQNGERFRLYVRETFATRRCPEMFGGESRPMAAYKAGRQWLKVKDGCPVTPINDENYETLWDAPDTKPEHIKWTPAIHMPKWASRIFAPVVNMRVERLQDISDNDVVTEGVDIPEWKLIDRFGVTKTAGAELFAPLWDSINGPGAWDENPEVVVCEFKPER